MPTAHMISTINWQGQDVEVMQDQWIVRLADPQTASALAASSTLATLGENVAFRPLGPTSSAGLLSAPGSSIDAINGWLHQQSGVLGMEPNYVLSTNALPNDDVFDNESTKDGQWGLHNEGQDQLEWDPSVPEFNGTGNSGTAEADIDAPEAWDVTTGSTDVVIGVLDTGIDYRHPDLYKNIWINQGEIPSAKLALLTDTDSDGQITFRDLNASVNLAYTADVNSNGIRDGHDLLADTSWADVDGSGNPTDTDNNGYKNDLIGWNFASNTNDPLDDNFHGTHVAGTIGAQGNNNVGVSGVSWDVSLMPLKFILANGSATMASAIEAIEYSTSMRRDFGVNVVATNNSYGFRHSVLFGSQSGSQYSQSMYDAIESAEEEGILFVASAGNSLLDNDTYPQYPSSFSLDNIITVAATDSNDHLAEFSSYGSTTVDLAAPGVGILSTFPTIATSSMTGLSTMYETIPGTSMAAPHVTGVVALLAANNPSATAAEIKNAILGSVDPLPSLKGVTATGGRLSAASALAALEPITVSTNVDELDTNYSSGDLSLREALYLASTSPGRQVIDFSSSLAGLTITTNTTLGRFVIDSDVVINGPGISQLTISGGDLKQVFFVGSGVEALIRDVTIRDGYAGTTFTSLGGAIRSEGDLTLDQVQVLSSAAFSGGGIYQLGGALTILESTISQNTATAAAGIYATSASVTIHNSTIDSNNAQLTGGIYLRDSVGNISNTTISTNTAASGDGGGVYVHGTGSGVPSTFTNVTITQNDAGSGNGGGIKVGSSAFAVTLINTIVADNYDGSARQDVYGTFDAGSEYNLIGVIDGSSSLADSTTLSGTASAPLDARLFPLGDYGGPTRTHMPRGDSPAVNVRSRSFWTSVAETSHLFVDQRGVNRFDLISRDSAAGQEGFIGREIAPDIGAVEMTLLVTIDDDEFDSNYSYNDLSLREAIYLAGLDDGISGSDDDINVIEFSPELSDSTIVINSSLGPLVVDTPVLIQGLGVNDLTISGNDATQVFKIEATDVAVSILDLTIRDGIATSFSLPTGPLGAGIYSEGNLILQRVNVVDNLAQLGGGIAHVSTEGLLYIYDSTIADNVSYIGGGGVYVSSLVGNDFVVIESSTISGNESAIGGGILQEGGGEVRLANSTVSGNTGEGIRAINSGTDLLLFSTTVADNSAAPGLSSSASAGGITVADNANALLFNTIVATNGGGDINGTFNAGSNYILIGDGSEANLSAGTTKLIGSSSTPVDARLSPLDDNGGPTKTHALLSDSPAIDFGITNVAPFYLWQWGSDQRGPGFNRVLGANVDLGSYEYGESGGGGSEGGMAASVLPQSAVTATIPADGVRNLGEERRLQAAIDDRHLFDGVFLSSTKALSRSGKVVQGVGLLDRHIPEPGLLQAISDRSRSRFGRADEGLDSSAALTTEQADLGSRCRESWNCHDGLANANDFAVLELFG